MNYEFFFDSLSFIKKNSDFTRGNNKLLRRFYETPGNLPYNISIY